LEPPFFTKKKIDSDPFYSLIIGDPGHLPGGIVAESDGAASGPTDAQQQTCGVEKTI
jgi:hypothetical protein